MEMNSDIETKARQLLEGRLASVQELATADAQLRAAREAVTAAEKAAEAAWSTTTAAGWTDGELRQLGFSRPARQRGGRTGAAPRRRGAAGPRPTA